MNWQRALFHVWGNPHLQACWCRYERRPVLLANPPLIIHGPTVWIQSNRSIVEKFTAEAQRALGKSNAPTKRHEGRHEAEKESGFHSCSSSCSFMGEIPSCPRPLRL